MLSLQPIGPLLTPSKIGNYPTGYTRGVCELRVAQEKTGKSVKVREVQPKLKTSAKEMSQT
jgi:hypothetical protein